MIQEIQQENSKMEEIENTVRMTMEVYGKPRKGFEEFLKTCKLHLPFLPETNHPSLCKGYELSCGLRLPDLMIQPYYDSRVMKARPDDVLVASYPKTGTTWTQEITYLIMTDVNIAKVNSLQTEKRIPCIDVPRLGIHGIEQMSDPRLLKTHFPYEELPESFIKNKTKIVYITRNPKDTFVSNYHFAKMVGFFTYSGTFESYFEEIINGRVMYSNFADNVLSYWNQRNSGNVCFMFYEDLQKDFHAGIRKIAGFLNKNLTDEQVDLVANYCSFDSMSKNPMTNYSNSGTIILAAGAKLAFMRKGKVGDWKNYFTDEMSKRVDDYVEKHFKGTGLEFQYEI